MLDVNGFKRKTYDELVENMSANAKEQFGANANVGERAFLGILIRIVAWYLALLWQDAEDVYHSAYRKSAEGTQLDKLLPYAGTTRILADYAYGQATFNGTPYHPVGSGFLVGKTNTDITYETINDIVLDANGRGTADIVCTVIGEVGNTDIGTITTIINPDANVTGVTNEVAAEGGREKETDAEARNRAEITVDGLGSATSKAIRAAVITVSGVRAVQVYENDSDEVGLYGTPPNTFQTFVLGGTDQEIAEAIYSKKPAGIRAYGTTEITVLDSSEKEKVIGFSYAVQKKIKARMTLRTNAYFNASSIAQIKESLAQKINSLNMSGDVIHSQLIISGFVEGVDDVSLLIGTTEANLQAMNVLVGDNEVAQITKEDIEVIIGV